MIIARVGFQNIGFEGLPPVKLKKLEKHLKQHGVFLETHKGKTHSTKAVKGSQKIPVPRHGSGEISGETVRSICKELEIPRL